MPVEDVFTITGRGTVVTGRVEQGIVKTGEEVEIVGLRPTAKTGCTGVEMFRKLLDQGQAGDNIGALLRGTKKEEVERGQVLAKPGSITPHTNFEAQVYILTKEEGGRHKPFFNNYRPQFYFRTTDVTGSITLPEGTEMVMPGDNVVMTVELQKPIAMDEQLRFAIREGGRTVAAGRVPKIVKYVADKQRIHTERHRKVALERVGGHEAAGVGSVERGHRLEQRIGAAGHRRDAGEQPAALGVGRRRRDPAPRRGGGEEHRLLVEAERLDGEA